MANASGGSRVPGHIHHCPLQWLDDTLPDHCHLVVVPDALDLVVPLLDRHLGLCRRGLTTKGVNSGVPISAQPQPCWGGSWHLHHLKGAFRSLHEPAVSPSPPSSECHFPVVHAGFTTVPRYPQIALGQPMWACHPIPSSHLFWRASSTSHNWSSSRSWTSLVSSMWDSLSRLGSLGTGWVSTSYLDMHPNTRGVTAPCSNVVPYLPTHQGSDIWYRAWWPCHTRPWPQ